MRTESTPRFRPFTLLLALFAVAGLVLAGCASHSDTGSGPTASPDAAFPVTLTPAGAPKVTIPAKPQRIVSLDASNTEILFKVGAGAQVVAVDKDSNYPAGVPRTQLDGTKPNVEAIAGHHPDLVVTAYNTDNLVSALQKVNIPVLWLPAPSTVDQDYAVWTAIGTATGHKAAADQLVSQTRTELDQTVAATPKPAKPLSYYYELDPTYYTATSHTFIGALLARLGLTNIGDPADSASSAGYPQLSAEQILAANPNLILLADSDCCAQNASTIGARPGWNVLSAVRDGNVVPLGDDVASRWGPRIVDLMQTVSKAVVKAAKANG